MLGGPRKVALRMVAASRRSTTLIAQRDFWLEFSWLDQEYRDAVRRLTRFCLEHTDGLQAAGEAPQANLPTGQDPCNHPS